MLDMGASPARTIKQNASAPPNIPNFHNTNAIGATIRERHIIFSSVQKLGLMINSNTAIPEKTIQKISLISLFFKSIKDADPSMTADTRILTRLKSEKLSNIFFFTLSRMNF